MAAKRTTLRKSTGSKSKPDAKIRFDKQGICHIETMSKALLERIASTGPSGSVSFDIPSPPLLTVDCPPGPNSYNKPCGFTLISTQPGSKKVVLKYVPKKRG